MAGTIDDYVLDNGLNALGANATRILVCGSEPTNYASSIANAVGSSPTFTPPGSPAFAPPVNAAGGNGRTAWSTDTWITPSVTTTANWWEVVADGASRLLVHGTLSVPVAVVATSPQELPSFPITLPALV
jgi:hypothetical protein